MVAPGSRAKRAIVPAGPPASAALGKGRAFAEWPDQTLPLLAAQGNRTRTRQPVRRATFRSARSKLTNSAPGGAAKT